MKVLKMTKILFEFLRKKEKLIFNKPDIFISNNQEARIFEIYSKKWKLLNFASLINKDLIKILSYQNLLIIWFLKLLSQNKYGFSYKCQSKLAKTLLKIQK